MKWYHIHLERRGAPPILVNEAQTLGMRDYGLVFLRKDEGGFFGVRRFPLLGRRSQKER